MLTRTPAVKMDDYKKPEGGWDFQAYGEARRANGEKCTDCGSFIIWHKGYPSLCDECTAALDTNKELVHSCYLRCPKCGHKQSAWDRDGIYGEGEHSVYCGECDHEYTIETRVTYEFVSPSAQENEDAAD